MNSQLVYIEDLVIDINSVNMITFSTNGARIAFKDGNTEEITGYRAMALKDYMKAICNFTVKESKPE